MTSVFLRGYIFKCKSCIFYSFAGKYLYFVHGRKPFEIQAMKLTPTQRKNLVPLVLFLANLVFLYIGGLVFESIEYQPKTKHTTADDVSSFLQTFKATSVGKAILPADFDSKELVKKLKSETLKNLDAKFEKIRSERTAASKPRWSFSNSLFFATTVVTTIGKM